MHFFLSKNIDETYFTNICYFIISYYLLLFLRVTLPKTKKIDI